MQRPRPPTGRDPQWSWPGFGSDPVVRARALIETHSPYLTALARREPEIFDDILAHGPRRVVERALRRLRALPPATPRAVLAAALRGAKRHVALATALADLGGVWPLETVCRVLSRLAETALDRALAQALAAARASGELPGIDATDPCPDSGFIVLGMGKLGAHELNYSSDIDLILLYDPDRHGAGDTLQRSFNRIAADLVALMSARDADGYVFRVDLRLRPDPSATPPAMRLPAAIAYYESLGRDWERAAMIKARPVAGDLAAGARFLAQIRPFVWRRHLDFAAIDAMRTMKRRIDARHRDDATLLRSTATDTSATTALRVLSGRDLKLAPGGIREIEFLAQTLQLVWGGRAPQLRTPATLAALAALRRAGHLGAAETRDLARCYRLLRTAEHRLQMQQDRQTHALPASEAGLDAFARFMALPDRAALAAALLPELRRTRIAFEGLLAAPDEQPDGDDGLDTLPELDDPELVEDLAARGFADPAHAAEILRLWRGARPRALRAPQAQALLAALLPRLVATLAAQPDPDRALQRFDRLIFGLPAGIPLLSLLRHNPALIDRIGGILGSAPWLAEHLAATPSALEGLLLPSEGGETLRAGQHTREICALLRRRMAAAADTALAIEIAQRLVRGEEFRLATALLETTLDIDQVARAATALADTTLQRLLVRIVADHAARHGPPPGAGVVIVALGKAGSREMMAGSDLDLMLVYDPGEAGPGAAGYYSRLVHGLIGALTAPGREGPLYAVDMRLRPSGSQGPVAVSLDAFIRYHAESAWVWERMALTRARVVAGPAPLRARVTAAIDAALHQHVPPWPTIRREAASMRARLGEGPPTDIRLRRGGLMEVEFIAQALQLGLPAADRAQGTRAAFSRLARAGRLDPAIARRLSQADHAWRATQGALRILIGPRPPANFAALSPPTAAALLRCAVPDLPAFALPPGRTIATMAAFEAALDHLAATVRADFIATIGRPRRTPAPTGPQKRKHGP